MGLFKSIGKVIGKVAGFAGGLTGNPLFGLATSALGTLWQNREAKDAASRQMNFQADMSNSSYQRAMHDMRLAGLNPILAYQQGGASAPSGASYTPQNVGTSAMAGGVKGATMRNLVEQNNNLQANSALQRMQADQSLQQTRRLALENQAYATLSPQARAFVLSGSGIAGGVGAAHSAVKAAGGLRHLKFPNPLNLLKRR